MDDLFTDSTSVDGAGSFSMIMPTALIGLARAYGSAASEGTLRSTRKLSLPSCTLSSRSATVIVFSVSFAPNESVPDVAL